jgi:hypothetical protein
LAESPTKKAEYQLDLLRESKRLYYTQHTGEETDTKMAIKNMERLLRESLDPKPHIHIPMPEGSDPSKW